MKVLHILNELKPSGAETMLCVAGTEFVSKGASLEVLSTGSHVGPYSKQFEGAGYRVRHLPFSKTPDFFLRLYRLLRKEKYDVIHLHTERANFWIGLVTLLSRPKRALRTVHSCFEFKGLLRFNRSLQRRLLTYLGLVHVSIGASVEKNEKMSFGLSTHRVSNWFNDRHFRPMTTLERQEVRRNLGVQVDEVAIVSVGNCSEVKNHTAILRALANLPSNLRPVYLHVGAEEPGQPEQRLARNLGISERVRFLGPLSDVRPILSAADLFVMPSLYEGFSIAAIEALGMGLPAIFADVPGLRDFKDEIPGLVYISPDAESLGEAMECILRAGLAPLIEKGQAYATLTRGLYGVARGVDGYWGIYCGG